MHNFWYALAVSTVNRKIVEAFALIFCNFSKQQEYCTFFISHKVSRKFGIISQFYVLKVPYFIPLIISSLKKFNENKTSLNFYHKIA